MRDSPQDFTLCNRILEAIENHEGIQNVEFNAEELEGYRKLLDSDYMYEFEVVEECLIYSSLDKDGEIVKDSFEHNIETFYEIAKSKKLQEDFCKCSRLYSEFKRQKRDLRTL